jgi:hypothetical protein
MMNDEQLKRQVKHGGGIWVGIQPSWYLEDLVLFNDRHGNTLAMRKSQVNAISVRERIAQKERQYAQHT